MPDEPKNPLIEMMERDAAWEEKKRTDPELRHYDDQVRETQRRAWDFERASEAYLLTGALLSAIVLMAATSPHQWWEWLAGVPLLWFGSLGVIYVVSEF